MKRVAIVAVGLALVVGIVLGGISKSLGASAHTTCTSGAANAIWTEGNGHCYMRFDTFEHFYEARRDCENRGGYLATLTSAEEDAFVWANVGSDAQPWFGFSDAFIEGQWQWITGEVAVVDQDTVYTNWGPDEPNDGDGSGEDGATYSAILVDGTWNDLALWSVHPYICEVETTPSYAVGGFAEYPALAGAPGTGTSGMGGTTYAVLAGAAAGVLAFAVLATLSVKRWRVR